MINLEFLELLKNRIDLKQIPFTDRGSRILLYRQEDYFVIRLAERWIKRHEKLSAYRQRPPLVDRFMITDEYGNPLNIKVTTYPHLLSCETAIGLFSISFHDQETLLISLPDHPCGVTFQANVERGQTDRRGGILQTEGPIRRNIVYTTNARVISNQITASEDNRLSVRLQINPGANDSLLINITPRLGYNRYLPDRNASMLRAAEAWNSWFNAAPRVQDQFRTQYYFAWWVMRAGLISTRYFTTRESMTPSKFYYLGVWQWDAYFHAIAYRHIDMELAKDQLRVLIDHQREDGMLPDAVHDEGVVTHLDFPVDADVTKPPLVAWAAWKIFEMSHDIEFLNEIYEPLVRWNRWWFEKNDQDRNGLCEYQHPFSSGLDDSPLWDNGMPVESPDLNTYLCLQLDLLSKIAATIGEPQDAKHWNVLAKRQAERMITNMWDQEAGLFWAKRHGKPIWVRTPVSLFPLLTDRMPPEVIVRLVDHLKDEKEFWPRYPVPMVALNDPHFNPEQMWRGPTWININYLLIEGLQRHGYSDLAIELRKRTLELVCSLQDIYEYYHPITGAPPVKAAPIFGWSAAILIDLAIKATNDSHTTDK